MMVEPFEVFQEADRMDEEAGRWLENFELGRKFMKHEDAKSLEEAYGRLTLSARSFPDSWVAADCHRYRADILEKWGNAGEAEQERRRVREFYVPVGSKN